MSNSKASDWQELTRLTRGAPFVVTRVELPERDIAIEGRFEPPPLSTLDQDDQVFVAAFVGSHGSIKEMERMFGVSYPTIKNRLNRISKLLKLVDIDAPPPREEDVLGELEAGRIDVPEALRRLGGGEG